MLDPIEFPDPLLCCLISIGLDLSMAKRLLPNVQSVHNTWHWAFRSAIDTSTAFEHCICAICLNERYAFQVIALPCGYSFCAKCF